MSKSFKRVFALFAALVSLAVAVFGLSLHRLSAAGGVLIGLSFFIRSLIWFFEIRAEPDKGTRGGPLGESDSPHPSPEGTRQE